MSLTINDKAKATQLRKHKTLATGLFLLMVVVYILMTYLSKSNPAHWIGYIKAFSEAAMVGALADWFAVTALFHHPLGIPIPHTNLIEKSKKSIGDNLGNFVVSNFLTAQNIRPYILKLSVSSFVADWLGSEKNKKLVIEEVTKLLKDILRKLDDETITKFIASKGVALIDEVKLNKVVASALQYFVSRNEHQSLITNLAGKIKEYISQNQMMVQDRVKEESYFFVPKFIDNKLASKITNGLIKYFEEIELDHNHKIRAEISTQLAQFVEDMRTLPKWEQELNKLKQGLLSEENIAKYATDIWQSLKTTLTDELSNPESGLVKYFTKTIDNMALSLKEDVVLQERIDKWIRLTLYKYILRNKDNVGMLISNTVGNWQGRELSQKLELEVGKDLQFIRINGTLVGGLVGLLIYAITHLLS